MIYQRPDQGVYNLKCFPDIIYQIMFSVNIILHLKIKYLKI